MKKNFSERQNEIVDIALALIADGGMANFTIKNLAENLGVTEPAVYRHFKGKSEITRAIIGRFDLAVPANSEVSGFEAVAAFARARFAQVSANPPLARVMFSEEIFIGDAEFSKLMMSMMHRHKSALEVNFAEAKKSGEIRLDIPSDVLFRLVFGPVRLLVKQWGMTNGAFDLSAKGEELIDTLRSVLKGGDSHRNTGKRNKKNKNKEREQA